VFKIQSPTSSETLIVPHEDAQSKYPEPGAAFHRELFDACRERILRFRTRVNPYWRFEFSVKRRIFQETANEAEHENYKAQDAGKWRTVCDASL
jgi:hypothetical protein